MRNPTVLTAVMSLAAVSEELGAERGGGAERAPLDSI